MRTVLQGGWLVPGHGKGEAAGPWDLVDFPRKPVKRRSGGSSYLCSLAEALPPFMFWMEKENLYLYDSDPCIMAKGGWTCHANRDIQGG